MLSPAAIVPLLDLTLLDSSATPQALQDLVTRAVKHGVAAVCVLPAHVAQVRAMLAAAGADHKVWRRSAPALAY